MSWFYLVVAGLLEVCWAVGLKYTDGFTKLMPSVATIAALVTSVGLLAHATRSLPVGTAYAVWVGIGALGTAVLGIVLFREPPTAARLFFLGLLLVAIIGLKLSTADGTGGG